MCGILGSTNSNIIPETFISCLQKIKHRGPDETIIKKFEDTIVTFGMNRLAIRDLHSNLYPFSYKQYRLIINGEIYNTADIQKLIPHFHPQTSCDAELILPLYQQYGPKCFNHLTGMFAVAILDLQKNEIILARDKFGEKPLYYSTNFNSLFFASETRAFPKQYQTINPNNIPQFLTFGFIPNNNTFFQSINKLVPGSYLKYSLSKKTTVTKTYYHPNYQLNKHQSPDLNKSITNLDNDLNKIIKQKIVADVPVGIFLSGGLDSSLITALAKKHTKKNLHTFSVGFENQSVDESKFSQLVAKHLQTKHHHLIIKAHDISKNWKKIISSLDEPISDPAIFPTYLLAQLARKSVTVVLSGEGADEIFCGYPLYQKELLGSRLRLFNNPFFNKLSLLLPHSKHWRAFSSLSSHYTQTIYQSLWQNSLSSKHLYSQLVSQNWKKLLQKHHLKPSQVNKLVPQIIQIHDLNNYLAEQLCMKVDKMTMQHSLECRAPFLDEKLIKYLNHSAQLLKQNYSAKYLLRQVAKKYLPKSIYSRPKHGFALPLNQWLNHELKSYVNDLYSPHPLISTHLSSSTINNLVSQFKDTGANEMTIWNLITLNSWLNYHSSKTTVSQIHHD